MGHGLSAISLSSPLPSRRLLTDLPTQSLHTRTRPPGPGTCGKIGYGLGTSSDVVRDPRRSLLQTPLDVDRFRVMGNGLSAIDAMCRFGNQVPGGAYHERCDAAISWRCPVDLEDFTIAVYCLVD